MHSRPETSEVYAGEEETLRRRLKVTPEPGHVLPLARPWSCDPAATTMVPGQPSAYRPRCCARSVAYPGASFKGQCGRPGLGRRPVIIHCTKLGSGESQGFPSAGARPLTSTTPQRCVYQKTGRLAGPHPLRGHRTGSFARFKRDPGDSTGEKKIERILLARPPAAARLPAWGRPVGSSFQAIR